MTIDREMVERAANAYNHAAVSEGFVSCLPNNADEIMRWMTAALTAAGVPELARKAAAYDELIAGDIHSCHDQCQREACVLRRELDALQARVAASPTVEITACNQVQGARDFDAGDMYAAAQQFEVGQRVRLLAEPQESV